MSRRRNRQGVQSPHSEPRNAPRPDPPILSPQERKTRAMLAIRYLNNQTHPLGSATDLSTHQLWESIIDKATRTDLEDSISAAARYLRKYFDGK